MLVGAREVMGCAGMAEGRDLGLAQADQETARETEGLHDRALALFFQSYFYS